MQLDRDFRRERCAQQSHGVGDDGRERDHRALCRLFAAEREDLPNEIGGAPGRRGNGIEARNDRVSGLDIESRDLDVGHHRRQQIVEVVRDATGERADGFHLLCLAQLRLEDGALFLGKLALADVQHHGHVLRAECATAQDRGNGQRDPRLRALVPAQTQLGRELRHFVACELRHALLVASEVLGMNELLEAQREQFFVGVAEKLRALVVRVEQLACRGIDVGHTDGRLFEQRAKALFARAQLACRPKLLGDVVREAANQATAVFQTPLRIVIFPFTHVAVGGTHAHHAVGTAFLQDLLQIHRKEGARFRDEEILQIAPDQRVPRIAKRLLGRGIHGEERSVNVVRADEVVAVLDEIAVVVRVRGPHARGNGVGRRVRQRHVISECLQLIDDARRIGWFRTEH